MNHYQGRMLVWENFEALPQIKFAFLVCVTCIGERFFFSGDLKVIASLFVKIYLLLNFVSHLH